MTMHTHREEARKLGDALTEHDAKHNTFTFVRDHAALVTVDSEVAESEVAMGSNKRRRQRRPSMIRRSADLLWISSKIDKFQSRSWWAGSFLIFMRIMQTSIMVFIVNPELQAAAASLVALVGVAVQTHAAPHRRPSDNHSALAAAWLLFIWSFVLLVRYTGAVDGQYGVLLGALPIAATVVMVAFATHALAIDVRKNVTSEDTTERDAAVTGPESVAEEEEGPATAAQRTTEEAEVSDVEMTVLSSTEPRAGGPSPSSTGEASTGSRLVATSPEGSNFLLGMLCVVGKQPDDAASATATATHAEEVARLRDEIASLREEVAGLRKENGGQCM